MPEESAFRGKGALAREQIERAVAAGIARGIVLGVRGERQSGACRGVAPDRMAARRGRAHHYWLSTLPGSSSFRKLVFNAMGRWMIERDYEELKSELGLSHYEGRNWRGFHHHATLCIAAYGFLMLEQLRGKKNARPQAPAIPQGFRPRGSLSHAAPQSDVHRLSALRSRTSNRTHPASVSLLRQSLA